MVSEDLQMNGSLPMTNRQQFVSIDNSKSEIKPIIHGVPQGSVLGPPVQGQDLDLLG